MENTDTITNAQIFSLINTRLDSIELRLTSIEKRLETAYLKMWVGAFLGTFFGTGIATLLSHYVGK